MKLFKNHDPIFVEREIRNCERRKRAFSMVNEFINSQEDEVVSNEMTCIVYSWRISKREFIRNYSSEARDLLDKLINSISGEDEKLGGEIENIIYNLCDRD